MLRRANVLDDTRCQAAFTEQKTPASQATAAKVLGTMSRLPGMTGEANDAVKGEYTSQNQGRSQIAEGSADRMLHKMNELRRSRRPATWDEIDDPVFLWNVMCTATP